VEEIRTEMAKLLRTPKINAYAPVRFV